MGQACNSMTMVEGIQTCTSMTLAECSQGCSHAGEAANEIRTGRSAQ